jgi:4-diphosphocytidyl-2-C-methyl-D-erythritol kinase
MLRLFSPAKINLFLRVVSKRPDGYHELSSVFQAISLGDTLSIELHDRDQLTCRDPLLPVDDSNLVLKAIRLFRRKTNTEVFFKVHLDKRIPTQAGLGGGSSNGATALWACNQLTGLNLPLSTLAEWGGEIGSDIPFFFSQGTAYCTGRGESVHHLPPLAGRSLWIIKPPEGLSTPEVYGRLNLKNSIRDKLLDNDLEEFLSGCLTFYNDLEPPAFELSPKLKELKKSLIEGGFETVLMTGSGSAFFCLGEGKLPADPKNGVFQAYFINRTLDQWYQG